MARIARACGMICGALVIGAGPVSAQYPGPALGILRDLARRADPAMTTSFAMAAGTHEFALDALARWRLGTGATGGEARFGVLGRQFTHDRWTGVTAGLDRRWTTPFGEAWAGFDVVGGGGTGPSFALRTHAGGRVGVAELEVRALWSSSAPRALPRTSASSAAQTPSTPLDTGRVHGGVRVEDLSAPGWSLRYTEVELALRRTVGKLQVAGAAGLRFGDLPEEPGDRWAHMTLMMPVAGPLLPFVRVGNRLLQADRASIPGRLVQFGFTLAPARSRSRLEPSVRPAQPVGMFDVRPETDSTWVFTLRWPGARQVDLSGDLLNWDVLSLTRVVGAVEEWRGVLKADPGLYHVVVRIDGGRWIAPPGLVTVDDGFSGVAGLLMLP